MNNVIMHLSVTGKVVYVSESQKEKNLPYFSKASIIIPHICTIELLRCHQCNNFQYIAMLDLAQKRK